jgi:membrane protein DedA with SNARE-associated domain
MEAFSQSVIATLETIPPAWQMVVLGFFSFAEGLPVIGSILPGGTIAIFAGGLSAKGIIAPLTACLLVGVASFLGDMTGFFLGKRFRHLKWIQAIVSHEKHQKSWDIFDRHIAIITIFGKLIPVVRSTPSVFAAIRGIRTRRYIIYSFIGSMLWGVAGVYAGNFFTTYFGERALSFILGLIVLSIVGVLIHQGIKALRKKNAAS